MTTTEEGGQRRCALCRRAGQLLVVEAELGAASPVPSRLVCADEASCAHAQQAREASLARHPSGQGRSEWRDGAERAIADAQEARGQPGVALVHATCAVAYAGLAIAEAITSTPGVDLTGILDDIGHILNGLPGAIVEAADEAETRGQPG